MQHCCRGKRTPLGSWIPLWFGWGEDRTKSRATDQHAMIFSQVRAARMRKTLLLL